MYVLKLVAGYIKLALLRFLDLADVDSYVGQGGKLVIVKPGGDGLTYASSAPVEINVVGEALYTSNGFAIQGFGGVTVSATGTDGGGLRYIKITGGGALPSGTNMQTVYYNGTTLTATSALRTDGTYVGIGASPSFGQNLTIGDAGSGEAIRSSANSGTVARFFVNSGKGVYVTATGSGVPVYSVASTGYGSYSESDQSYGAFITSRQHGGAFVQQNGMLTANNTGSTLTISRALLGSYTALEPLLRVLDVYGSGGDLAYMSVQGNERFRINALGMVFAQMLNTKSGTATLGTTGTNNDVELGNEVVTFLDAGSTPNSLSGIAGGVQDQIRILVFNVHTVLPHESTSSDAENQFYWPSGVSSSNYAYLLWYNESRWWVLFFA